MYWARCRIKTLVLIFCSINAAVLLTGIIGQSYLIGIVRRKAHALARFQNPPPPLKISTIPNWLLFRSTRSAILQAERLVGRDLDIQDIEADIQLVSQSCEEERTGHNTVCNVTLLTLLRIPDSSSGVGEIHSFQDTTRPYNIDDAVCNTSLQNPSSASSDIEGLTTDGLKVLVDCRHINSQWSSRILVVLLGELGRIHEVLDSWVREAESGIFPLVIHVLFVGTVTEVSAAEVEIRSLVKKSTICAKLVPIYQVAMEWRELESSDVCPSEERKMPQLIFLMAIVDKDIGSHKLQEHTAAGGKTDLKESSKSWFMAAALRVAGRYMNQSQAFDYALLQGQGVSICRGSMSRISQSVLSLRRAFSLVRCGLGTSCLLFNARDVNYWSQWLEAMSLLASSDRIFFHLGQGLNVLGQRQFGDASIMVTRATLVESAHSQSAPPHNPELRCDTPMTKESFPASIHIDEIYSEQSGCVPSIDFLSPCADTKKSIDFLSRPQWLETFAEPDTSISVQVLTNDRPAVLFRTVSRLLGQVKPSCITIHVDGVNDHRLSNEQRSTLRVVRWFSRMYGTRWRRNPDRFHASFTRRTGFRRNYDNTENKHELSNTDRLIHMTWNSLAYAFDDSVNSPQCTSNATVVLEDDLLAADDMMEFFSFGLKVMQRDEKVKVVSAWNDNSFNIREGLDCAVQRGEHFMGLGWLTTRRVYDELVNARKLWPINEVALNNSAEKWETYLSIQGGWETPFLNLFDQLGVGLFPVMNRVYHQASTNGWSASELLQTQLLDAATIKPSGPPCSFREADEGSYEQDLTKTLFSAAWIDFKSTRCFRSAIAVEEGQTFVVALQRTQYGWDDDFAHFLLPFSWIRGFSKVRGSYKDVLLVHVAQHLMVLLGPMSNLLKNNATLESRFQRHSLSPEQAREFFNESCAVTVIERQDNKIAAAASRNALSVLFADPGQDCDSFCQSIGRVCRRWSGIYTGTGTRIQHGNSVLRGHRTVAQEAEQYMVPYGHIIPHNAWSDLPVLRDGQVELGLVRLFQCNVTTDDRSRRLCPCLNASFARRQGARGLFVDGAVSP